MNYFRRMGIVTIVHGIVILFAGILFCIRPFAATGVLSVIIGIALLLSGAMMIIHYLSDRKMSVLFDRGSLVIGIILLVLGAFILLNRDQTTEIFAYVFGLFIIVDAISKIENAIMMSRLKVQGWFPVLILALLMVAAAVYMLLNAEAAILTLSVWIGASLIIEGITSIYSALRVKAVGHNLYRTAKDVIMELEGNIIDEEPPVFIMPEKEDH